MVYYKYKQLGLNGPRSLNRNNYWWPTPFIFSGLTMQAVGSAAGSMIEEVRRQFREIPGLKEGKKV